MVVSKTKAGIVGYGTSSSTLLSFCHLHEWQIDTEANIHIHSFISLFFFLPRWDCNLADGKHISCVCSWCWQSYSEAYFGKDHIIEGHVAYPIIKKNTISNSLLCRDGFKLVLESNKCVLSKYEILIHKGHECGGLFRLSLSSVCNNV